MHTEGDIRRAIKPLVEMYGELDTSGVKQHLDEVLDFDSDDCTPSTTRKEMLIIQRIGNIVAHQGEDVKVYAEGFIVDKSTKPARFIAARGFTGKEKGITEVEITAKKKKSEKSKRRIYKDTDWDGKNERRTALGKMGEAFAYEYECNQVKAFAPDSLDKVIHLSVTKGDGFGYDILSLNKAGEPVFIEVKTTTGKKDSPFYMSRNEKAFFEDFKDDNAYIYRVYNFDAETKKGQISKIAAKDLVDSFSFEPVDFIVEKK